MMGTSHLSEAGYRILPRVYDRWQRSYGKDYSETILPRLLSSLRKYRIAGTTMVDVACGTGSLAILMAREGWHATGVDASEGMIACAAAKSEGTKLPLSFLRQDMRELRLEAPVHLATSFFDSLNHLLDEAELLETFRRVFLSLLPEAWFVFDTSNKRCFSTLWTMAETITTDEFIMTLENSYDPKSRLGKSVVTLEDLPAGGPAASPNAMVRRETETVLERCYGTGEIWGMLEKAGFVVRECEEFNFTSNPGVGNIKTWWVAQKHR